MIENDKGWGDIAPLRAKTPFPTKIKSQLDAVQMHHDFVGGMAVNDEYLFTSSEDATVKIWDRKTLKYLKNLGSYDMPVNFIALSEDGAYFATADDAYKVCIYEKDDKEIFKLLYTLHGHTDYVSKLAFAGKHIISASKDGTLKVWDYIQGTLLHTLAGHGDWVYALATSPDAKWVISSALNSSLNVWDIQKGVVCEKLLEGSALHYVMGMTIGGENPTEKGNQEAPNYILWIADKVITVAKDIAVWDTKTWQIIWYQDTTNRYKIKRVSYVASENILITAGERIEGWDLDTGKQSFSVIAHEGEELYSCTLWNDEVFYTGGKKGDVKIWNVKELLNATPQIQHTSYVYTLKYLPEAQKCITTAFDGTAIIYDKDAHPIKQIPLEDAFGAKIGAVLPNHPTQVVLCSEGRITIMDLATEKIVKSFILDNNLVNFEDLYCLSDTKFLGTTLSYLPRLIDLDTNEITIYEYPFTPTHFVPYHKKMIFTSYPTEPIDTRNKDKYTQEPASLKTPSYKKVKGIDLTNQNIQKTSCFFVADASKMQTVKAYWLPKHIKLKEKYDKSYPMYAYPIDDTIVVVHYSGSELVVWNIPDEKVILALSTEEEYLMYVFMHAGKLYVLGKSGNMTIYNTKNFQAEKNFKLASEKSYAHTYCADENLFLFSEDEKKVVAWDLNSQTIRFRVNLKFKISKLYLHHEQLFVGSNDGRLFSFEY